MLCVAMQKDLDLLLMVELSLILLSTHASIRQQWPIEPRQACQHSAHCLSVALTLSVREGCRQHVLAQSDRLGGSPLAVHWPHVGAGGDTVWRSDQARHTVTCRT